MSEEKNNVCTSDIIRAISLFSGAGGDTHGMLKAGIKVVGYVEYDKTAIKTHERNFPQCVKIGDDITKITDEKFREYEGVDIIFGGFPCQSFSHGGKKDPDDARGFLYQEFVRAVRIIKPKIIIGENVKGLLSRRTSDGELFIDNIIRDFSSCLNNLNSGYDMKYELFDMSDFGIPQSRKRVIIYGVRKDLKLSCNLSNIMTLSHRIGKGENITPLYNKDILEFSLVDALKIEKKDIIKEMENIKCIENKNNEDIPTGKPPTNLVKCYNQSEISFKTRNSPTHSCIIDLDDVSRTILCSYGRMPRLFVPLRNANGLYLRPYTVLELQRIQSFPDTFEFSGSYIEQIKQIGNAIPPVFVKHIMSYIKDILTGDIIEL